MAVVVPTGLLMLQFKVTEQLLAPEATVQEAGPESVPDMGLLLLPEETVLVAQAKLPVIV